MKNILFFLLIAFSFSLIPVSISAQFQSGTTPRSGYDESVSISANTSSGLIDLMWYNKFAPGSQNLPGVVAHTNGSDGYITSLTVPYTFSTGPAYCQLNEPGGNSCANPTFSYQSGGYDVYSCSSVGTSGYRVNSIGGPINYGESCSKSFGSGVMMMGPSSSVPAEDPEEENPGNFTLSMSPANVFVTQGALLALFPVTLTSVDGLSGTVNLSSLYNCPPNATCSFSNPSVNLPANGTVNSTFKIMGLTTTPPGVYSVGIRGVYVDTGLTKDSYGSLTITPVPPPTVTLNATPSTIASGNSATLNWIIYGATTCSASLNMPTGNWSALLWGGAIPTTGNASTGVLSATQTYTLTCVAPYSSAVTVRSVTVTVTESAPPEAAVSIEVESPEVTIPYNTGTNISWDYSNASLCIITPPGSITTYPSGSGSVETGDLTQSRTYTITCDPGAVNSSVTVEVEEPSTYQVTVTKIGQGTVDGGIVGINCGSVCSAPYPEGSSITFTATPLPGKTFNGWGEDCASNGKNLTCTLEINSNKTIKARFSVDPFFREF